ncbi:hypothetical protein U1Q18_045977 [Sarracenia purpurea var. burkii]
MKHPKISQSQFTIHFFAYPSVRDSLLRNRCTEIFQKIVTGDGDGGRRDCAGFDLVCNTGGLSASNSSHVLLVTGLRLPPFLSLAQLGSSVTTAPQISTFIAHTSHCCSLPRRLQFRRPGHSFVNLWPLSESSTSLLCPNIADDPFGIDS